jgi:hypothetical protein
MQSVLLSVRHLREPMKHDGRCWVLRLLLALDVV